MCTKYTHKNTDAHALPYPTPPPTPHIYEYFSKTPPSGSWRGFNKLCVTKPDVA